ncbi:MAG TPA: ABC transporter permease, partial [Anaeromyxobacteraceae bacterium]
MRAWRTALVRGWAELSEGVRIAFGTLAAHRLRSFLTTLGIVIGVTTVIAIIAIIQGIDASFEA